jgi:uncharacterized protein involved in outer membrane biogenesis
VAGVIEDVGSGVLKTEVSVAGVSIDLKQGKAGIAGLTIANPDGYSSANLFELEGIEVSLALDSIGKEVLVIDSVIIADPKVSFEVDEKGGNNMQALLDNMGGASPEETSAEEPAGEEMKLIIDQFAFTGGQVSVDSPALEGESRMFELPGVKMSGIGRKQGGVTPGVVAEKIVKELVNAVIKAAAEAQIDKAIEEKKKSFLDRLKGDG